MKVLQIKRLMVFIIYDFKTQALAMLKSAQMRQIR